MTGEHLEPEGASKSREVDTLFILQWLENLWNLMEALSMNNYYEAVFAAASTILLKEKCIRF